MTERVQVYTTNYCGYCVRAKQLLTRLKIAFEEIDVSEDSDKRDWLVSTTRQRTVPQIFIDGRPIGGYVELAALERAGGLRELAAAS
ncbi:MAG TPA: glutaredoxin 3 [Polyangiales bacterium]|nr:glutaredoxin 3 [Polyangiales bacterium]